MPRSGADRERALAARVNSTGSPGLERQHRPRVAGPLVDYAHQVLTATLAGIGEHATVIAERDFRAHARHTEQCAVLGRGATQVSRRRRQQLERRLGVAGRIERAHRRPGGEAVEGRGFEHAVEFGPDLGVSATPVELRVVGPQQRDVAASRGERALGRFEHLRREPSAARCRVGDDPPDQAHSMDAAGGDRVPREHGAGGEHLAAVGQADHPARRLTLEQAAEDQRALGLEGPTLAHHTRDQRPSSRFTLERGVEPGRGTHRVEAPPSPSARVRSAR